LESIHTNYKLPHNTKFLSFERTLDIKRAMEDNESGGTTGRGLNS